MYGQLALFLIRAALVSVQAGREGDCPSSRQIADALQSRLPGLVVPFDQAGAPGVLRLALIPDPTGGPPSFTLADRTGRPLLRRSLAPQDSTRVVECPALAETVALMVERYLQDLEVPKVSAPAAVVEESAGKATAAGAEPVWAATWWDVFVGSNWRPEQPGSGAYEIHLGAGRILGTSRRFLLVASAGITGLSRYQFLWGGAQVRRIPADLQLLWRADLGRIETQVGAAAGLDVLALEVDGNAASQSVLRTVPFLGVAAAVRLALSRRFFVRVISGAGAALMRYDFLGEGTEVAFGTRRSYLRLGVQAGVAF